MYPGVPAVLASMAVYVSTNALMSPLALPTLSLLQFGLSPSKTELPLLSHPLLPAPSHSLRSPSCFVSAVSALPVASEDPAEKYGFSRNRSR